MLAQNYEWNLESNLKHVAKRAMGVYDTGSQLNSSKQNKQGLNASNAISLIADRNMLDNATKSGLEKVNNAQDTSYRDMANATQKEYDEAVADIIEGGYANKRLNTMSKDWEDNKGFFTHVGNALMLPLDAGADMLKSATTMVAHGMSGNIFNDKANAVLNETKLADKSGASMQVFGSGANNDDLLQMSNYLDEALKADKKTSLLWDTEAKPKLAKYLKAQGQDKDKAWQEYQNAMQKVQTQWDKAPSKLLASSELIGLAETMRNQHDYGRFVLNLFKNPNENKELAQSYLTDLQTILKQNDKFKDVSEVVLTKSGQVAVKRGDNYETLEQGFLDSILHGIYDSVNEIGLSIGGAKGASKAKSTQGKVVGAITDEQINSWTTNYKNPDGA